MRRDALLTLLSSALGATVVLRDPTRIRSDRVDGWAYATVRIVADTLQVRESGEWAFSDFSGGTRDRDRIARVTMAYAMGETDATSADFSRTFEVLTPVVCANGCGRICSTPDSIRAGMGPTCRGEVAARSARMASKRAYWKSLSFGSTPTVEPAPTVDKCDGTCSLDSVCKDCG